MSESRKSGGFDLQRIRDELVCPLCISTLQKPRSLHCLHSYCEACLVKLHQCNVSSNVLLCPECRLKTTLPEEGVTGMCSIEQQLICCRSKF